MPFATRPLLTLLLASAFAAPAFAGGDIVKCVGADGRVTITDSGCDSGPSKVLVPAMLNTAPGEAPAAVPASSPRLIRASIERVAVAPEPVMHDNFIDPRPRGKMLARDAETLRAARTSLQAIDGATRQQRVAGLN